MYSGGDKHKRGVGLTVSERQRKTLVDWQPVSERVIVVYFKSRHAKCTIAQMYVPTNVATK